MQISELRDRLQRHLLDFAWNQWAQMGILAEPSQPSPWTADPEALLLLTFEVGRKDPRLFDETLDWIVVNGRLVSQQRLRNLYLDEQDRALADAALAWAAQHQRALRSARTHAPSEARAGEPLFPLAPAGGRLDPVFAAYGWSKAPTGPSGKSRPPRLELPINFAFRLRRLFGTGSRAEVVRFLVTSRSPGAQAEVIRRAAGFAKRNVLDAANDLVAADVLGAYTLGASGERFYHADLNRWRSLLRLEEVPAHRDWPQLLGALRLLHRELEDPSWNELSEYLRASEARQLMSRVEPDLRYAGVQLREGGTGADYWDAFVENVDAALSALVEARDAPRRVPGGHGEPPAARGDRSGDRGGSGGGAR